MKMNRFGGLLVVATFFACSGDGPTGVETEETAEGIPVERVSDIAMFKAQQRLVVDEPLQCETVDFEQFEGGTLSDPFAPLTFSALGVDVDVEVLDFEDPADMHDLGTGQILIFDTTVPSSNDPDLVDAGESAGLGNVLTHQSGVEVGPGDADVTSTIRFTFPTGDWYVAGYSALDQEGATQDEFIALHVPVFVDGETPVAVTSLTTDFANAVEVIDIDPEAPFSETMDFRFDGSGAIDDVEVCKAAERGGEGCTPGYWKQSQHFGSWPVDIDFTFAEAFDGFCSSHSLDLRKPASGDICDLTLLEALDTNGGHQNALARHAAAAWLNAGSTVDYFYAQTEVEEMTEAALMSGTFEPTKHGLEDANEAGCPLGRAELDD